MKDKNIKHNNCDTGCKDEFSLRLIDLIDNTLTDEESALMKSHMEICPECRDSYRLMMDSMLITKNSHDKRLDYIDGMELTDRKRQINNINQLIISEKNKRRVFSRLFLYNPKHRAFASAAAGIVVLVFITFIFSSMNNLDIKGNFTDDFGTRTAEITGKGSVTTDAGSPLNEQSAYTQGDRNADSSPETGSSCPPDNISSYGAEADSVSVKASDTGLGNVSASSSSSSIIDSNKSWSSISANPAMENLSNAPADIRTESYVFITPEISSDLWKAVQGFTAYYEMKNDSETYLSIISFKKDIINSKKNIIIQITEQIKFTVKIEIISGENTQKLVEYTSKETADLLSKNAVSNGSDLLIISIGR